MEVVNSKDNGLRSFIGYIGYSRSFIDYIGYNRSYIGYIAYIGYKEKWRN